MTQKLKELQNELLASEQWREELARKQRYEAAAYHRAQENLLRREMARLRLKLNMGRGVERE